MLAKTHLAITLFFVLLLLPYVSHQISFVFLSLVATFLPDIDTKFSKIGKHKGFRIIQIFLKHRGVLHSFLFLLSISILLAFFFPILALPFFLGYGLHLITDSFSVSGVRIFYPFKKTYSGVVKTGTRTETLIFLIFLILDASLLASIIFN